MRGSLFHNIPLMKHNVCWWTEAHTLTPYQPRRLSEGPLLLIFAFPTQFEWLPAHSARQWYNFPSTLNLLHWKFNWLGFDCLWTCRASVCFQRWKLMLSFWQHCYSTNRPDGGYSCPALHEKMWGFHMQNIKQPVFFFLFLCDCIR